MANLTISREATVADDDNEEGRPLTDVLKFGDEYLGIRTDVSFVDAEDGEHEFDFEYDYTSEKFGAGTAFFAERVGSNYGRHLRPDD